jgi:hypothetical protein
VPPGGIAPPSRSGSASLVSSSLIDQDLRWLKA